MAAVELENSTLRADGNLVQYHRLESVTATVGNDLTNTGSVAFAAAIFNNGAIFDGTTKKLDATVGASVDGSFSVVVPLILTTEITSGFYGFWEATSSTNKLKYILFYNYNSGTPQVIFKRKKESVAETDATYNISLGTASSHQIGASYDGTNMRLYVDGVLRATVAASGNGTTAVTDTYSLGWSPNYGGLYAKAKIDDVALFTRVLTDTEFTNRYDGTDALGGSSPSPSISSSPSPSVSSSISSSVSPSPSVSSSLSPSVSSSISSSPSPSPSVSSSPSPSPSPSVSPSSSLSPSTSPSPSQSTSISSSPSSSVSSSPSPSSFTINNPTGTVSDGHEFVLRIKTGSSSTITWDTAYRGALPATTTGSNATDYLLFKYNLAASSYDLVIKTMNVT